MSYAMTSPLPIVDPLSPLKKHRLLTSEKVKSNQIAIHFLATCRAYHVEGSRFLWKNNSFIFTSPEALRHFGEVPLIHRETIRSVNFRVIAKFFDDEERVHKLPTSHHPDIKRAHRKLVVHKRPKEHTLARRGFRAYAYYQLIDFLEAMLPPFDPPEGLADFEFWKTQKRPRLFPNLDRLRVDFVNFSEEMLMFPPTQLHDLASHQMGCSLNEVILTGLPSDDVGFRVSSEMGGLLKDEGLIIDHAPTMVALKNGVKALPCDDAECHYSCKVVRAMRNMDIVSLNGHDYDYASLRGEFPPAPKDDGEPPSHLFESCRTIWKKVPVKLEDTENRKWDLFDRISGLPWEDVEDDVMFMDLFDGEQMAKCQNCGKRHRGAILDEDLSDTDSSMVF